MPQKLIKLALAIGAVLVGSGAWAATGTGLLTVTASVVSGCTIGAATLAFGVYDPVSTADNDVATTVQVICTSGSGYSIYSTTPLASRVMITDVGGAGKSLRYGVYGSSTDRASGTQLPLTNTTGKISGTGNGLAQNVNLYGRVAALQNVVAGVYTNAAALTNLTIEY